MWSRVDEALLSEMMEGLFCLEFGSVRSELLRGERGKIGVGKTQGNSGQEGRLRYACGGGNGGDRRARSQRNGASYRVSVSSGPCEQRGCSGALRKHEA